jgi:hypothetical protein
MAKKAKKKLAPLGSGKRFSAIASKAAAEYGSAKAGAAVAAAVGRKRYGTKKMAKLSVGGRKRTKKGK